MNNQSSKRQNLREWKKDSSKIDKVFETMVKQFVSDMNEKEKDLKDSKIDPTHDHVAPIFKKHQDKWLNFCNKHNNKPKRIAVADAHAFVLFLARNGVPEYALNELSGKIEV